MESMKKLTGAQIFFECLKREKVEVIFGYPGGANIDLYEQLYDIDFLTHVLPKHEQGATHMADGYARATGKVGVVLTTSGPGATNTITGIANAYLDSAPLVIFTGQVATGLIGNDAFQEADIVGITRPITKHNFLVRDVREMAETIHKAFYLARSGRPGPVLVDLPKNVLQAECDYVETDQVRLRGYKPEQEISLEKIKQAAEAIKNAKKPLLYAGGGIIMAGASEELRDFARKNKLPVTMTLQGLGAFPSNDRLSLGMLGMHGTFWANQAVNHCDVLVALGARFDDRVTGKVNTFAKNAKKIHVDIDPANIDKNVLVDIAIVGDVKKALSLLMREMDKSPDTSEWLRQIEGWKKISFPIYSNGSGKLRTRQVIRKLSEKTQGNAVIVSDVGQHQMWVAQTYDFLHPRTHLSSGGLGTMGFSVPAAIGASFGIKDKPVISVSGDGGLQMNLQELITAAKYNLPIKFLVINNNSLGMVRQWQELFYNERYSFTDLTDYNPDFVRIAEAMGIPAFSVNDRSQLDEAFDRTLNYEKGPILVEFQVVKEELVFPMVPSGASVSEMILDKNEFRKAGVS